jgi:hypothetical protein
MKYKCMLYTKKMDWHDTIEDETLKLTREWAA